MDYDLLKARFSYSPETGEFRYLHDTGFKIKAGSIAGSKQSNGYISIQVNGKRYLAHRLAWLYVTGDFPSALVDHIDHNVTNNSWQNLRAATQNENAFNMAKRAKGATFVPSRNKWRARIVLKGKHIFLGYFGTFDEAKTAYNEFAEHAHGEFCCN